MSRKPLSERFNRSLMAVGNKSLCVTIPVEYLRKLGWEKGHQVKMKMMKNRKRIIIEELE